MNANENLIPFNLRRALDGANVVTRDGRRVTQLRRYCTNSNPFKLAGVVAGDMSIEKWTEKGRYCEDSEHINDLFMADEENVGWIYFIRARKSDHPEVSRWTYRSKEEAQEAAEKRVRELIYDYNNHYDYIIDLFEVKWQG